jgi:hypothetical protein
MNHLFHARIVSVTKLPDSEHMRKCDVCFLAARWNVRFDDAKGPTANMCYGCKTAHVHQYRFVE